MRKKSILKQLLIPMLTLAVALPAVVLVIFTTSYEQEIYKKTSSFPVLWQVRFRSLWMRRTM